MRRLGAALTVLASLVALVALASLAVASELHASVDQLRHVQAAISGNVSTFCYHAASGTKNAFTSGAYKPYAQGLNVLVYPFCLETRELGNRLGNYLHELACAHAAGLHFVTVHSQWDVTGSINNNQTRHKDEEGRLAFLRALPDVVAHAEPLDRVHAADRLNKHCKCNRYCWQHADDAWVNRTDIIRGYLQTAVQAYLGALDGQAQTVLDPENDLSNAAPDAPLPLIPDVAIQYRCGDNLGFSYRYGILPFTAFDARVPADAKLIYVLSDHPSRALHNPNTARCKLIMEKLFEYLRERFPAATVVVKRGGDVFLDYARLALARTTICSVSSYCFWPAVSNPHTAYFPLTSLIAGADVVSRAPDFGPHFRWMNESYVSNFKGLRPWTQIVDVLTGKMPIP